jgi:hypothetical protein
LVVEIDATATPDEKLTKAVEQLEAAASAHRLRFTRLRKLPLRIVVRGGFYAPAPRPQGLWSEELASAAATDLERVCPVPFDLLQTAAIPIDEENAWVCGLQEEIIVQWEQAASRCDVRLEGLWTASAALMDFVLEQEQLGRERELFWQDGHVRFQWEKPSEIAGPLEPPKSQIRVFSCNDEAAASASLQSSLTEGQHREPLPIACLPALAASLLTQIDPSESLNLLRGNHRSVALVERRRRPLAAALAICAIALLLFSGGNLLKARAAEIHSARARAQLAALWHLVNGSAVMAALPVTTLEQQSRMWQAASEKGSELGKPQEVLGRWSAIAKSLPPDLAISVTSVRSRGSELWIDGHVATPADARRLEEAWSKLPSLKSEPLRLTSGAGGQVSFSARMTAP